MNYCPWPDNPLWRLSAEDVKEDLRLAAGPDVPAPFSHFGTETLVPARCRLCPYLFEGECIYPIRPPLARGRTQKSLDEQFANPS